MMKNHLIKCEICGASMLSRTGLCENCQKWAMKIGKETLLKQKGGETMIKLGDNVRDNISGFSGIATGRSEFLFGCKRILIEPKELKDGIPISGQWIDEQRIELVEEEMRTKPVLEPQYEGKGTGGPQNDCRR